MDNLLQSTAKIVPLHNCRPIALKSISLQLPHPLYF